MLSDRGFRTGLLILLATFGLISVPILCLVAAAAMYVPI